MRCADHLRSQIKIETNCVWTPSKFSAHVVGSLDGCVNVDPQMVVFQQSV